MISDLAVLHPGSEVTDDRVPGSKKGLVIAVLPPDQARVVWRWPGVCAGHSMREEKIVNLSLVES